MSKKYIVFTIVFIFIAALLFSCSENNGPRPEDFEYQPLEFSPPSADEFRTVLSNGLVVYIAEDHEIPWFDASMMIRTGPFLEPENKLGIAGMTSSIMRTGGTTTMDGEKINERIDFLAGSVSATGLSIHTGHLDEGLKIWMDILNNPAFPNDKIRLAKERAVNSIRNRNKNVSSVGRRTFSELVYGQDSPITAQRTERLVNGIVRNDLVSWYNKYWGANNAILIVSGDFDKDTMLEKLEETFGKWNDSEKANPKIPQVKQSAKAGVYMIEPEVIPNQGVIRIGHLGVMQDNPDYPAVDIMNYILGGGSFSSRITKIVRSDNGLAYSTGSRFSGGILYPGTFAASCQTKNSTVVFACQLMLNEIEKIRNETISEEDLNFVKAARISALPSRFSSTMGILRNFASLEFNNRPMDYYSKYVEGYEKVTVEDVQNAAKKYLQPENIIIMVSGNIEESRAGADKLLPNQQTIESMAEMFGGRNIEGLAKKYGDGEVHILPLK